MDLLSGTFMIQNHSNQMLLLFKNIARFRVGEFSLKERMSSLIYKISAEMRQLKRDGIREEHGAKKSMRGTRCEELDARNSVRGIRCRRDVSIEKDGDIP